MRSSDLFIYFLHGSDTILILNCTEKFGFVSPFYTHFKHLNDVIPCNKYEQIMPSFLSANCFEDKAIYIIKNLFQLTKGHLVP